MMSAGTVYVAATHGDDAVERVAAHRLLDLEGEEVAVEHAGRLHEALRHRHHGISTGNPPACQTPRFTSSSRVAEVVWQLFISDHV